MKRIVPLFLSLLVLQVANAQRNEFASHSEILLAVGGMNYIGDLNNQSLFSTPHLAFGGGLRYRFDNRLAMRGTLAYGNLSGGNPDYNELRNLNFHSPIFEGNAVVEFCFWPYATGTGSRNWTFFAFAGLGFFHFNPKTTVTNIDGSETDIELHPLCTEGQGSAQYPDRQPYALNQFSIPLGIGVTLRLGKHVTINAEYALRLSWTDYLDDVSTTYVGADVLEISSPNPDMAILLADRSYELQPGYVNAPGIKRGDDSLNDLYSSFNISIGINLEPLLAWTHSKRCPR